METKAKQSYDEQPNPPTTEENVRLQSLAAANTLWACLAREVAYGENDSETSVADKIEAVEATIAGKANTSHTHTYGDISGLSVVASTGSYSSLSGTPDLAEVATSGDYNDLTNKPAEYVHPATHPASMITGLSDVATSGSYTDLTDKPTIPIVPTSLPADGGNADTVDNKHASDFATANHTHTQYASTAHTHEISDVTGLAGELDGKAAATHTHSNYAAKTHTHTLADISETTEKKVMTAAERTKLNGIATGANNYSHPATHPASIITGLAEVATSGSYDDLTDKPTSMSPTAHTHAQSDITGLATALSGKASTEHTHAQDDITGLADALAGKASSSHTHGAATTTANGMMSAADKAKLDGIATGANKTVVDSAMSATSTNPVQNKVINTALSGKANSSHTHAQSAITGLTDALAGKAAANHNHDTRYISKSLQLTADDGDVSVNWTGQNVVSKFLALPCGMCTAYSAKGTTGNPNDDESFRFICHKTGTNLFGWVMAHGAKGSVYSGYVDNGTWRGWKCIYESTNSPLWSGAYYMNASQTVTPSKPLSKCRNGWILVWSDYDPSTSKPTGADHFTVAVPKLNGGGATWSGQSMTLAIPSALSDSGVLTMAGKKIYIHDAKITGHAVNKIAPANDVVLRAVYEY